MIRVPTDVRRRVARRPLAAARWLGALALVALQVSLQAGCSDGDGGIDASRDARVDVAQDANDELDPSDATVDVAMPDVLVPSDAPPRDGAVPDASMTDGAATDVASADVFPDGPWVRITAPPTGATVANPGTFRVAAGGVTNVRLFADEWPMGAAWNPTTRDNLVYTFTGPSHARQIRLLGLNAMGAERARDAITITASGDGMTGTGTAVATMYNTYYYLAREADYTGAPDTALNDGTCRMLATVPAAFSDSVCVEGSGILRDGRIINYSSSCTCGRRCPTGGIVCYSILDGNRYPWGSGASSPLTPLRSWAVDRTVIPLGTVIYVARWDGARIPAVDGLGGFTHDGCFRADDTGGAITGNHFDFFAGTRAMWRALEMLFPTRTNFAVERGAARCAYLLR